jgi:hypothetical protein
LHICGQQRIQKLLKWLIANELPKFSPLSISSSIKFWFVTVIPKCLNCDAFSNMSATFMSQFWSALSLRLFLDHPAY